MKGRRKVVGRVIDSDNRNFDGTLDVGRGDDGVVGPGTSRKQSQIAFYKKHTLGSAKCCDSQPHDNSF